MSFHNLPKPLEEKDFLKTFFDSEVTEVKKILKALDYFIISIKEDLKYEYMSQDIEHKLNKAFPFRFFRK